MTRRGESLPGGQASIGWIGLPAWAASDTGGSAGFHDVMTGGHQHTDQASAV